ncbi:hypothetical protein ACW2QC_03610 [Virgibacillus sp. FSP13]
MKIIISLIVVFIISFLLLFLWIYSSEKEELKEKRANLFHVVATAFILALGPTVFIGLSLFVLLGSANTVTMIFSLHISTNQLIILAISFFVYLFTIDSVIERIVKYILGRNKFNYVVLLLIRIIGFYLIGKISGLNQTVSITIAVGVAFITLLIEVFFHLREKNKQKDVKDE